MYDHISADELIPPPDDEIQPEQLVADWVAMRHREREQANELEERLRDAGFTEATISEQPGGLWRFDLVFRGRDDDGSAAFGFLERLLVDTGLVSIEDSLEMEIERGLAAASFLCSSTGAVFAEAHQ